MPATQTAALEITDYEVETRSLPKEIDEADDLSRYTTAQLRVLNDYLEPELIRLADVEGPSMTETQKHLDAADRWQRDGRLRRRYAPTVSNEGFQRTASEPDRLPRPRAEDDPSQKPSKKWPYCPATPEHGRMVPYEPATPEQAFCIEGGGRWLKCMQCTSSIIEQGSALTAFLASLKKSA